MFWARARVLLLLKGFLLGHRARQQRLEPTGGINDIILLWKYADMRGDQPVPRPHPPLLLRTHDRLSCGLLGNLQVSLGAPKLLIRNVVSGQVPEPAGLQRAGAECDQQEAAQTPQPGHHQVQPHQLGAGDR